MRATFQIILSTVGAVIAYTPLCVVAAEGGSDTTKSVGEHVTSAAAPMQEIVTLTASDGDSFARGLGLTSMAIKGDWIAVGAPFDWEYAYYGGAVYVFRRVGTTWVEHEKLTGIPVGDTMGYSVAMTENWLVAGAPSVPDWPSAPLGIGRAYVFRRDDGGTPDDISDDGWQLAAILNPPPSQWCCGFGAAVDIDADTIAVGVGTPPDDQPRRVHVFRWDGLEWLVDGALVASDSEPEDAFGRYVAVAGGDHILVAAPYDEYPCEYEFGVCGGSVYAFRHHGLGWIEEGKLTPVDPGPYGAFALSLSADADAAIVGGNENAHVFRRHGEEWVEEAKLTPSDYAAQFGRAVSLSAETAVIGAPYDNNNGRYTGAVYVFRNGGAAWSQSYKFIPSDANPIENLGTTVSVSGNYAVAGPLAYALAVGPPLALPDFALFQQCFLPQEGPLLPECERFDSEPDGVIDLSDHALMLQTFRGP